MTMEGIYRPGKGSTGGFGFGFGFGLPFRVSLLLLPLLERRGRTGRVGAKELTAVILAFGRRWR